MKKTGSYRRYHSHTKLLFAQHALPQEWERLVPRSTRQRWKNIKAESFWNPNGTGTPRNNIAPLSAEILRQVNAQRKLLFRLVLALARLCPVLKTGWQQIAFHKKELLFLLSQAKDARERKRLFRYLPFSSKQWRSWTERRLCPQSLQQLCRKRYPQQLSVAEIKNVHNAALAPEYRNWPLSAIYYQLLRAEQLDCSLSTFYKYCRLMQIRRSIPKKTRNKHSICACKPLTVLHQDITIYKTKNGVKHYIYVIRDNYSRAILACKASLHYSSTLARQALKEVWERFNLDKITGMLITDNGPENRGALEAWIKTTTWRKLVAQVDICQSNSMVEAVNKILKYRFLYVLMPTDTETLTLAIEEAVKRYNSMPNAQLYGLTPDEVLNGSIPDKFRFRQKKKEIAQIRLKENLAFRCDNNCRI